MDMESVIYEFSRIYYSLRVQILENLDEYRIFTTTIKLAIKSHAAFNSTVVFQQSPQNSFIDILAIIADLNKGLKRGLKNNNALELFN